MRSLAVGLLLFVSSLNVVGAAESVVPATMEELMIRANERKASRVLQIADELLVKTPPVTEAYYWRGRERLRGGQFADAVSDFDRFADAFPSARPRLWERGIACYYAGQFEQGARQFSDYQTHDDNDVENAVWHLLCLARVSSWKEAREKVLKVRRDSRVPMTEILQLYLGELRPDGVLAVAKEAPNEARRNQQMFYAHLYIGLYLEAQQDNQGAKQHLLLAADQFPIDHYMWDLAKMHADRLRSPSR